MLNGCDVSYAQGLINWNVLAPSIDFALVRRGYGTTKLDEWGRSNVGRARALGIPLGHWWYLPMPTTDPLLLAATIATGIGGIQSGEPILLDIEEDNPQLVQVVYQVALFLRDHFGNPPLIYLSPDFLKRYDWQPVVGLNCGLWLAHWDSGTAATEDVSPFAFAALKQWTCAASLSGIEGNVCRDVFYGDAAQFRRYGALSPG